MAVNFVSDLKKKIKACLGLKPMNGLTHPINVPPLVYGWGFSADAGGVMSVLMLWMCCQCRCFENDVSADVEMVLVLMLWRWCQCFCCEAGISTDVMEMVSVLIFLRLCLC